MRPRLAWHFGAAVGMSACAGCFPAKFTTRPAVKGVVVDAISKKPVRDARVRVLALQWATNVAGDGSAVAVDSDVPAGEATTGPDGTFDLKRASTWGIFIVPMDVATPGARVLVEAPGRASRHVEFPPKLNGSGRHDAGTIEMLPSYR